VSETEEYDENLSQDSCCPSQDSNQAPLKCILAHYYYTILCDVPISYMRHVLEIFWKMTATCRVYSGPVEAKIKLNLQYQCQILHSNIKCSLG
jgi:hypothetical protein